MYFSSCPATRLAVARRTLSERYSNYIFACTAKFFSASGSGWGAMSNRAGSALALPGVARNSPEVQANACHNDNLTNLLVALMPPPVMFESNDSHESSVITTREREKTPALFLYSIQVVVAEGERVSQAVVRPIQRVLRYRRDPHPGGSWCQIRPATWSAELPPLRGSS